MTVGDTIEVAREWVAHKMTENPDVRAVYLAGSVNRLPADAPMPESSDVDVYVIQDARGTWRTSGLYRGALLQCTVDRIDLSSPEAVLAHPCAQGILFGKILADPQGALASVRLVAVPRYAEPRWITARCEAAVRGALGWLDLLDRQAPSDRELASALVALSVAELAAACALAARRDFGGRKGLVVAREVLLDAGLPDVHARLLGALGVGSLSRERVLVLHRESLELCERAAAVHRTRVPGDDQIEPHYRRYVTAGAAEIIEQGLHREAMWRVHRTYCPAAGVLLADAPEVERPRYLEMWHAVRRDLGLASEGQIRARSAAIRALSQDILAAATCIVASA